MKILICIAERQVSTFYAIELIERHGCEVEQTSICNVVDIARQSGREYDAIVVDAFQPLCAHFENHGFPNCSHEDSGGMAVVRSIIENCPRAYFFVIGGKHFDTNALRSYVLPTHVRRLVLLDKMFDVLPSDLAAAIVTEKFAAHTEREALA